MSTDTHALSRLLREIWGDDPASLTPLVGEVDLNVRVVDGRGGVSVLKVMHPGAAREEVELQVRALAWLGEVDPELPVPAVVPTREGALLAEWDGGDGPRIAWRISWLPGRLLKDVRPRRPALLESLGATLARVQRGLEGFSHPAAERAHDWDLARAGDVLVRAGAIPDRGRRGLVEAVAGNFREELEPVLGQLPRTLLHGDANDHNVLVEWNDGDPRLSGLLDFGDMVTAPRVCDVAIAAAYALLGESDPVEVLGSVAAGFHGVVPLDPEELSLLLPLVQARLGVSVVRSAERAALHADHPYLAVSEAPAWAALERLARVDARSALLRIRHRCGVEAVPGSRAFTGWLRDAAPGLHPILGAAPEEDAAPPLVLDLSVGSLLLGADPANVAPDALQERIDGAMTRAGATVGVGRWDEPRPLYLAPPFLDGPHPTHGARTVHMGIDLWVPAGTPLYAPLDGVVASMGELPGAGDYGPTVLLRHQPPGGPGFFTLWGHLDPEVLGRLGPGDPVPAGALVARVGPRPVNGDWPPHLHLQVALDDLGRGHDLPGVVHPDQREAWREVFPNPALLAGLHPEAVDAGATEARSGRTTEALRRRRGEVLGTGLSLSYRHPLHLVRGWRQFLHDAQGRAFLDLYNNVPHVGHSHPAVVEAVQRQAALLNTNTRYLHDTILRYAEALRERLPGELECLWFLNSASEANELALRLARAATGRREILVLEAAYHGHTTTLVEASPYKFHGPGGEGRQPWVETVPLPDLYRGPYRREEAGAAARYGTEAAKKVREMAAAGRPPGAFLAESLPSVGGQIVLPEGYLKAVYAAVREAGGICISDDVQAGFGRLGEAFWGFELQGVVPDVVVLGKPAGNGFPLGVVAATRAVAEAFDTGMEFFSTYGGNPVACAAGLAVLEVLEAEGLQGRARIVGERLTRLLREVAARHPVVGDVRGMGLFQGVELVLDPETRTPAPRLASYLVERLAEERILTGTDGPDHNVLKLRGPLVVDEGDVDRFGDVLDRILEEPPFLEVREGRTPPGRDE